jgi:phage gp29-like protein
MKAGPPKPRASNDAGPTRQDLTGNLSKLAQLTPSKLAEILRKAETGDIAELMDLCDRIITTDGDIGGLYETRISAIAGTDWIVEPGESGDPARDAYAEKAARFVQAKLEAMRGAAPDGSQDIMRVGFSHAVTRLLDALGKSFAALEIPWEYDETDGTIWPRSLVWVHQRRFRWHTDWKLRLIDNGETRTYPGEELTPGGWLIHCPPQAGLYPWLSGALRAVAWCYLFKRWCRQFWVTGAESFAWPFLWAKVPRGAKAEVRAEALRGLEKLSADHRAVVEDGTAFEILESAIKDAGTWKQLEDNLNREAAKRILGSSDANEPGKVGAYGAVESRRGTTIEPRLAVDEKNLDEDIERQLFEPLIDFNLHVFDGVRPPTPHIRFTIASKRREISETIVKAKVVSKDELRASAGLPPKGGPEGREIVGSEDAPVADVKAALELARSAGLQPTSASMNELLSRYGVALEAIPNGAPTPKAIPLAPTDVAKVTRVSEARASVGLAPFGDERDNLTIEELAAQIAAKADAAKAAATAPPAPGVPPAD